MPRITSDHFMVGYIRAKMEQLRTIIGKLEKENRRQSKTELEEIQDEIQTINKEIQSQMKLVKGLDIETVMVEYRSLSIIAEKRLQAKLVKGGTGESSLTSWNQPSTSKGTRNTDKLSYETKQKSCKRKRATKSNRIDLEGYRSDDSEPMAIELLTKIDPGEEFKPVVFAEKENEWSGKSPSGREGNQVSSQGGESSKFSSSTFASYKSSPQSKFCKPVKGMTYPPMAWSLPYPVSRKDPNIIGMSEIFSNIKDNKGKCMVCNGNHKMYRCTNMVRAGLQERWYIALSKGVCLHCLYPRHSSFTCKEEGACVRCGTRHNSLLCPKNPNNLN